MDKVGESTLKTMKLAGWYSDWLFAFMKAHLEHDILEVGVGLGVFTDLLSRKGKVTIIDINKKYLSYLKGRYKKSVEVGFGDIEKGQYFFKEKKFNTVVCLNVLEHIRDEKKAIKNIYSLLTLGAKFILLVPAHRTLFSKFDRKLGHYRRYTCQEVTKKLMKAGFREVSTRYLNWWGAIGWFILLRVLGLKKMPKNEVRVFNYFAKFLLWPEKVIRLPFGLSVFAIARK